MVRNNKVKNNMASHNSSQPCVFAPQPVPEIVPWGPVQGQPQKCLTREQSNNLMSAVHIFSSYSSTSKSEKNSVNFASSTVLSSPQTSGWIVSNPEILYLSTISHYLSVSISLSGREGILFSTLMAWSLNSDCQQLGTCFSLSQFCPCFSGQSSNRLHWENVDKITVRAALQLYSVKSKKKGEKRKK